MLIGSALALLLLTATADGAVRRWFAAVAEKPFSAAAVREAARTFPVSHFMTSRTHGVIRIDAKDGLCSVEIGPFRAGAPQKVMMRCSFDGGAQAERFARDLIGHLRIPLVPSLRFESDAEGVQEATFVRSRQLVGVELHFLPEGDRTVTALVLVDRGPRIVIGR